MLGGLRKGWTKEKGQDAAGNKDTKQVDDKDAENIGKKLASNDSEKSLTKKKSDKGYEGKHNEKTRSSNFPCCFYIPLDIAMVGFALIDIIYYFTFALLWIIIISLEPFAGRDGSILLQNMNSNSTINKVQHQSTYQHLVELGEAALNQVILKSHHSQSSSVSHNTFDDELLDINDFKETTTTFAPIENLAVDTMNEARVYSRIALRFKIFGQEIDDGCGRDYFASYLYGNQLDKTRDLFEKVARKAIVASFLFVLIGFILLSTICCFRGYIATKLLIIFLWYMQLIPSYIMLRAAVMSQSHRFCILQYGLGKTIPGQKIIWWALVCPLLSYKPYEAFIWANYIRRYFKNKDGKLLDESYFSSGKREEREQKGLSFVTKEEYMHHRRTVKRTKLFRYARKSDSRSVPQMDSFNRQQPGYEPDIIKGSSSSN